MSVDDSEAGSGAHQEEGLLETVKTVALALLIALVIRSFLFQPFNIPSGSMIPTLEVGDFIFVSKYSYGYSRYSLPFSPPIISGRIFGSEPERGDVVVFRNHPDTGPGQTGKGTDFIKRVIGLPGDRVQMINGLLFINGEPIPRKSLGGFHSVSPPYDAATIPSFAETLPSGRTYVTLDACPPPTLCSRDNTREFVVPEGKFFVMGDNRDNSEDSRIASGVGFMDAEELIGKAQIIFFSFHAEGEPFKFWEWPMKVRWERLFTRIR
ncbi:MAG: signal peptidase I [Alphaproteobacteria bacterium]|nr:signal peptidase I [Alphaproteobacteria bacterium]